MITITFWVTGLLSAYFVVFVIVLVSSFTAVIERANHKILQLTSSMMEKELAMLNDLSWKIAIQPEIQENLEILNDPASSADWALSFGRLTSALVNQAPSKRSVASVRIIDGRGDEFTAGRDPYPLSKTHKTILIRTYERLVEEFRIDLRIFSGGRTLDGKEPSLNLPARLEENMGKRPSFRLTMGKSRYIAAVSRSAGGDWLYLSAVPVTVLYARTSGMIIIGFLIYMILTAVVVRMAMGIDRKLSIPIAELSRKLIKVESGRLQHRTLTGNTKESHR